MKNPPAFPSYEYQESYGQVMAVGGMTLRDYFAAKAMQGMLSRPSAGYLTEKDHAEYAYMMADAMLCAREEK
jgi:hypothetical protein